MLTVTLDGTFQKQGHVSFSGVILPICVDTEKVMDVEILTEYWKGCDIVNGNEGEMKQHKGNDACNLL